jgi:hypothetical protein
LLPCAGAVALALGAALAAAQAQPEEPPPFEEVDKPWKAKVVASFQEDLERIGIPGRISSCEILLSIRHQSRSKVHGAICTIGSAPERRLLMCSDYDAGYFTVTDSFPHDREAVHRFARANCVNGPWEPMPPLDGEIGNTNFQAAAPD